MQKASRWLSEISKDLAPLSLISAGTVNIVLFYFGAHSNDRVRRTLFMGAMILIFGLSVARAFQLYVQAPESRKRLLGLCALPGFICLGFAAAFAAFGVNRGLSKSLLESGVFIIPAFVFAVDTAVSHRERDLFMRLERWSLLLLPAALMYVFMEILGTNPTPRIYLGGLDYMSLAYTYVPCLFVMSISLLLKPFGGDSSFGGWIRGKAADGARICLILLLWVLIVLSGTRGAMFSVIAFYLLLLLHQLIRRKPVLRIVAVISGVAAVFLILNITVATPGMDLNRQRWGIVLDGLKKGRLTAEVESEVIIENIDALVKSPGGKKWRSVLARPGGPSAFTDKDGNVVRISNRGTLYTLAFKEFLKSPIYGMYPLGYFIKYENYPHNLVLEVLSELGLLGFIPIMAVLFLLARKLLLASARDITKEAMLVLLLGLVMKCMVSGTIWGEVNLIFACAYAAAAGIGFFKA